MTCHIKTNSIRLSGDSQNKPCNPGESGMVYLKCWKKTTDNQEYSIQKSFSSQMKDNDIPRETKAEGVFHH